MAIKDKAFIKRLLFIVFIAPLIITGAVGSLIGLLMYFQEDAASFMAVLTTAYFGVLFGALIAYPIMILFGVPLMLWIEQKKYDRGAAKILALLYGLVVCYITGYIIFRDTNLALGLGVVGVMGAWIVHALFFFKRT